MNVDSNNNVSTLQDTRMTRSIGTVSDPFQRGTNYYIRKVCSVVVVLCSMKSKLQNTISCIFNSFG